MSLQPDPPATADPVEFSVVIPSTEWEWDDTQKPAVVPDEPSPTKPDISFPKLLARASILSLAMTAVLNFVGVVAFGRYAALDSANFTTVLVAAATAMFTYLLMRSCRATFRKAAWWSLAISFTQVALTSNAVRTLALLSLVYTLPSWLLLSIELSLVAVLYLLVRLFGPTVIDRPASDPNPQVGFLRAVGSLIALLIVGAVVDFFGFIIFEFLFGYGNDLTTYLWALNTFALVVFAHCCVRNRYGSTARRVLALRWPLRPLQTALVVLLTYPSMLLCTEAATLASVALGRNTTLVPGELIAIKHIEPPRRVGFFERMDQLYEEQMKLPLLIAFIVVALLPALGEELFFRGLIGRGLIARHGMIPGVLLTSFLFALIHIDPVRMAATFLMGMGLHFVYLVTRSLWAAMLLHGVYNALVVVHYKVATAHQVDLTCTNETGHIPSIMLVAAGIAVAAVFRSLLRLRPQWLRPDGTVWSPGFVTAERPPRGLGATVRVQRLGVARTLTTTAAMLLLASAVAFGLQDCRNRQLAQEAILKGNDLFGQQEYVGAVEAYSEAIALRPNDSTGYSNRGLARVSQGEFTTALPDLDRALDLNQTDANALATRAGAYAALSRGTEALADFKASENLDPEIAKTRKEWSKFLQSRASLANLNKNHTAALADLNTAVQLDPTDCEAFCLRGYTHQMQGRLDQAIADYTTALHLKHDYAFSLGNRGLCHLTRKEYDPAIADLGKAIELQPQSSDFLWHRARTYQCQGDLRRAEGDYSKAITLDPENAVLRYERGQARLQDQSYRDAKEDYLAAVQLDPNLSPAHIALASLYAGCPDATVRDGRRAVDHASKANAVTKYENAGDVETLAAAYAEAGDLAAAVKWQKKAVQLHQDAAPKSNAVLTLKRYESGTR